MRDPAEHQDRAVLRGSSGYWIVGVLGALLLYLLLDAAVRGAWNVVAVAMPWLLAVAWMAWLLLVRPCVVVAREGLSVVNVFVTHRVPWKYVDELSVRHQLIVSLVDGRRILAWGSPTTERSREVGSGRNSATKHPYVDAASVIEQIRESYGEDRSGNAEPSRRFAWPQYAVLCVLLLAGISTALVA